MDRRLNSLDAAFRPLAVELLARCVEANIALMVINTRRTDAEQEAARLARRSWVRRSKHQDGFAIDVCPLHVYDLHGAEKLCWDAADPVWERIGVLGEGLGLRWGGRWKVRDLGHFEKA